MAVRMNITISEELHARLQSVKDAVGNVSGVCQTAIEKVVSMEESKMKAQTNREKAILRLKAEREQATDEYFQQGKQDGLEAAASDDITFQGFKALEALDQNSGDLEHHLRMSGFEWLFETIEVNEVCPESFIPNYVEGWVSGAIEFWQDIQSEVEN
jgi:post-segregation antitoxin (ccd killing protein)